MNRWRINASLVVVDYSDEILGPCLLFESGQKTLRLPRVTLTAANFLPRELGPGEDFFHSVEPINTWVEETLGWPVHALRCLSSHDDATREVTDTVWAMELRSGTPSSVLRVPVATLQTNDFDEEIRAPIAAWRHWSIAQPPERTPWSNPGWLQAMSNAVNKALRDAGREVTGPVVQVRSWERSTVLRFPTSSGNAWVKVVPTLFAHEVDVTAWISCHCPGVVPRVLAAQHDALGHWLIMEDHRGRPLDTIVDAPLWEQALRAFSRLQLSLSSRAEELVRLGCPLRSLSDLPAAAARLLADRELLTSTHHGLSSEEYSTLGRSLFFIESTVRALENVPIPYSLDHADLWSGQVILRGCDASPEWMFLDWSDCAVTHPFLSAYFFLDDARGGFDETAVNQMRRAYLEEWSGSADIKTLERIMSLVELVAPLERAVFYRERLLPSFEMAWEMQPRFFGHIRALLGQLP